MRHHTAIVVTAALVAAGVAIGTALVLQNDPTSASRTPSNHVSDPTDAVGRAGQGEASGADVTRLQGVAESAAAQLAWGNGLRVENKTDAHVVLVFPNGDTAFVTAGKFTVVLTPCRDRLPIRAERMNGELIAERDGPCRRRDTWVVVD